MEQPSTPTPPFDFAEWDAAQFRRAGEVLTQIAQRREGLANMRQMVLDLYFKDTEAA